MKTRLDKVLRNQEDNHIFPFLWLHGEEEATLREYMNVIHRSNIGAVCVESRPHPDFCGEKWWRDMDVILDEAKRLGMKIWILDDAHFPTGYANGALKEEKTELHRQSLVVQYVEVPEDATQLTIALSEYQGAAPYQMTQIEGFVLKPGEMPQFEDDRLLAIVAIRNGGTSENDLKVLTTHGETATFVKPDGSNHWKIAILHLTRNRGPHRDYINMMDNMSCRKLIDAVYQPHFDHYGDEFGKTIAGFFSDEPELGNGHLYEFEKKIGQFDDQCWSASVEERLRRKWQENFEAYLPLIWEQDFEKDLQAKIRFDYMDAVTKEVEQNFSNQIGDWCREHGVKYIGHLIEDNHQHMRTGSSLGHYFRGLAGQDMAGIDDIGGQVLPQREEIGPGDYMNPVRDGEFWHYTLGKLGGSLAAIDPRKHGDSMCEIFGNYGWSEGVRLEKYLADHFLVRGINHFVPHAFSAKEFPDPDCPPHFYAHGHNPQYRHFGALMRYMNRISTLISGGKAVVPVAILYNAEADWAGNCMHLQKPAIQLYDHQIDYHFVPTDVFTETEKYGTKLTDKLTVNGQKYHAFVIAQMDYIPRAAAEAAAALAEGGCKVLFTEELPKATVEGGNRDGVMEKLRELDTSGRIAVVTLNELVDHLIDGGVADAIVTPASSRIRIYHYRHENNLYMVVNEAAEAWQGMITVPGSHSFGIYDAWSNQISSIRHAPVVENTAIPILLEPRKSVFIILDMEALEGDSELFADCSLEEIMWNHGWRRSICKSIDYPNFCDAKSITLPDCLDEEEPLFSGFVRYEKTLEYHHDDHQRIVMEISDAYEGVEVFVNGQSLGIQIVPTFRYELTPYLRQGENSVVIEVATTLEREAQGFDDPMKMFGIPQPPVTVPSGINGGVKLITRRYA